METLSTNLARGRQLRRVIMRRVWYAFGLSLISRPAYWWGFVFGVCAVTFWQLVSISSIIHNLLEVRVGQLPGYILQSLLQADTVALLAFLVLLAVSLVVLFRLLARLTGVWSMSGMEVR